jgi:hypothetical protein
MAFTNHALDHMLLSVLDAEITSKIIRVGSRSSEERISKFSLSKLTHNLPELRSRAAGDERRAMKAAEEEMQTLMEHMVNKFVSHQDMDEWVSLHSSKHYRNISNPPRWIDALYSEHTSGADGWEKSNNKKNGRASKLEFWHRGRDLDRLRPPDTPVAKRANRSGGNRYVVSEGNKNSRHERKQGKRHLSSVVAKLANMILV